LGVAPHHYVVERRVERAKQLLRGTRASLLEISMSTGFSSQSHFNSTFHRVVGATPLEFQSCCHTSRRVPARPRPWGRTVRSGVIGFLFVSMLCLPPSARGQDPRAAAQTSPVGRWRTVDDVTGKVNSVVVIWEEFGTLYGKIEQLVDSDPRDPDPRCTRCEGAMKNMPLVGLRIVWELKKDGDRWSGGKILDPDNGKGHRATIAVEEGGRKLRVRGFIGVSMLGRTQVWLRDG